MLAIPSVLGCFLFEAIRTKSIVPSIGGGNGLIVMTTAAIVGYFVLNFFRRYLLPRYTRIFAVYCLVVGAASVILYLV